VAIIIDENDLERARQEKQKGPKKCDRLTAFLYVLLRDHLTIGEAERLMSDLGQDHICICTNGWLVEYAERMKGRISGETETDSSELCKCMQKLTNRGIIESNGKGEWLFLHRDICSSTIEYKSVGPCPICGKSFK
jgi:hypothetical protein